MNNQALLLDVANSVTAYAKVLSDKGIQADDSTQWHDLPVITKQSYLMNFPIEQLCRHGDFSSVSLIGASSGFGKTGAVYWPKQAQDEASYVKSMGDMFKNNYQTHEKRTLVLVCLAFGMWVAGMQIASGLRQASADATQKMTLATPGLNLNEAIDIVAQFGDKFEQVLIITNPSNVNIFMSLLKRANLPTGQGKFAFPVVGEFFSESARQHVADFFVHDASQPFCLWTGYGSADTGDIGVETRHSIALRQWFYRHPEHSIAFFGTADTPMILEQNPHVYVEIIDDEIIVTKDQFVPLIRYNTKDRGGILKKSSLQSTLAQQLPSELLGSIPDELLYVQGRASDSLVFYGTNLMVTEINNHLNQQDEALGYGGLFHVMPETQDGNQFFNFVFYVTTERTEGLTTRYADILLDYLKSNSLEFAAKYDTLSAAVGEPLIRVALKDISELQGNLKHKFIIG